MDKVSAQHLAAMASESSDNIHIVDFDGLSVEEGTEALRQAFRILRDHGVAEFEILDWDFIVAPALASRGNTAFISKYLFDKPRKAVWNGLSIAVILSKVGFFKAWTGHVPELPEHILLVKALKFMSPGKGVGIDPQA